MNLCDYGFSNSSTTSLASILGLGLSFISFTITDNEAATSQPHQSCIHVPGGQQTSRAGEQVATGKEPNHTPQQVRRTGARKRALPLDAEAQRALTPRPRGYTFPAPPRAGHGGSGVGATRRYTSYPGGPSAKGGGAAPLWRQRLGAEEVPVSATLGRWPWLRTRRSGPWRPRCLGKGLGRRGGRAGACGEEAGLAGHPGHRGLARPGSCGFGVAGRPRLRSGRREPSVGVVREEPPTGGTPRNGRGPGAGPGRAVELPVQPRGGRLAGSGTRAWLRFGAPRAGPIFLRFSCFCRNQIQF